MSENKKIPIIGIVGAINAGIPLVKDFIGLFKSSKKKTIDGLLSAMSNQQLIEHIKQLESADDKPILIRLLNFTITCATVYGVIYTAHKFGITYQQVIDLFGLIK